MSDYNFKTNIGFTYIYNWFIDEYMVESPVYSMVYIYALRLASQGLKGSDKIIANKLNIFESDVVKAWEFWQSKGVVKFDGNTLEFVNKKAEVFTEAKRSFYNPSDVEKLVEVDNSLDSLIHTVEVIMGKALSQNNINIIAYMYDTLALPFDVIILLVKNYASKNLTYIEKVAMDWKDRGIDTVEKGEAEISIYSDYSKILKFFGVNNRTYTANEKKYMESWLKEFKLPMEVIRQACEKAVASTGKVSFSYANKVLTNWHDKGVKTLEDIEKLDKKVEQPKTVVKPVKNVFTNYTQRTYSDEEIKEILRRKAGKK